MRIFKIGRIGRKNFILSWFALGMLFIIPVGIVHLILMDSTQELRSIVFSVFAVLMILAYLSLCVMRLHDLNLSGFVVLCLLVPLLNIWITIIMFFKRGVEGPNGYGKDPIE